MRLAFCIFIDHAQSEAYLLIDGFLSAEQRMKARVDDVAPHPVILRSGKTYYSQIFFEIYLSVFVPI